MAFCPPAVINDYRVSSRIAGAVAREHTDDIAVTPETATSSWNPMTSAAARVGEGRNALCSNEEEVIGVDRCVGWVVLSPP
jgi:hypothetical protein